MSDSLMNGNDGLIPILPPSEPIPVPKQADRRAARSSGLLSGARAMPRPSAETGAKIARAVCDHLRGMFDATLRESLDAFAHQELPEIVRQAVEDWAQRQEDATRRQEALRRYPELREGPADE